MAVEKRAYVEDEGLMPILLVLAQVYRFRQSSIVQFFSCIMLSYGFKIG